MTVIHGPAPDHRVELPYQCRLFGGRIAFDDLPDLIHQRFDALLCWFGQQLVAVLAYVLTEEVEPFRDMRDAGLLLRQFQPTFRHEAADGGKNHGFEYVL